MSTQQESGVLLTFVGESRWGSVWRREPPGAPGYLRIIQHPKIDQLELEDIREIGHIYFSSVDHVPEMFTDSLEFAPDPFASNPVRLSDIFQTIPIKNSGYFVSGELFGQDSE